MGTVVNEGTGLQGFAKTRAEVFPEEAVRRNKTWSPELVGKDTEGEPFLMWPTLQNTLMRHGLPASYAVIVVAMLWRSGVKLDHRIQRLAICHEMGCSFRWFRKALQEMQAHGILYNASPCRYDIVIKFYPFDVMIEGVHRMYASRKKPAAKSDAAL